MSSSSKAAAEATVAAAAEELVGLSHRIHDHPELKFEEERAADWCASLLAGEGFSVEAGVCDLPTAFVATAGSGPLTIGICAEYDALPGVGHACGHNVIAAAAVGAGLALAPLADELGVTIKVLGTPAEEGGGGKVLMLERGAFDGIHASMMVHPAPYELDHMPCLAIAHVDVHFEGKAAHASGFPHLGRNAADAQTVAAVAVGLLRQHVRGSARIHGIVTHGGDAPNIVPDHTTSKWYIREADVRSLEELRPRVEACFEAGALATGTTMRIEEQCPVYSEMRDDRPLQDIYVRNAEALGRTFPRDVEALAASTDMANISLAMPTIHPLLGLDCYPISNHQPEFAAFCITDVADKAVLDGATAMAWTVADIATDETQRSRLLAAR